MTRFFELGAAFAVLWFIFKPLWQNPPKFTAPNWYQAQEKAREFGEPIEIGRTGSMEPLIHGPTFVAVVPTPFAELKVGDIVVYEYPNLLVGAYKRSTCAIHRLVAKDSYGFIAAGDANHSSDRTRVTAANYMGRVAAIVGFEEAG